MIGEKEFEKNHNNFVGGFGYSPNEIKEETDDRIIVVENIPPESIGYAILAIFILFLLLGSFLDTNSKLMGDFVSLPVPFVFLILLLIYTILTLTRWLLLSYSVTIDKKSERIIIKEDSNINRLKSVKEIPFSDIKRIVIKEQVHNLTSGEGTPYKTWRVNLIKIQGGSTKIYETYYESDAEILAEKIRNKGTPTIRP
jgi:hypothetical protein